MQVLPVARVMVESEVTSMNQDDYSTLRVTHSQGNYRSEICNVSKLSKIEKKVQVKARMMEDGPRKRQAIVIGGLWTGKLYINLSSTIILHIEC